MKPNVTLWLAAVIAVSACGSSAQFASSGHQYQDGIYYKPTTENKEANKAEEREIQSLIKKTKESEIYLFTDSGRDTIVVPTGNSVRLNFNNSNNATVTFLDNDAFLYPGYYPYTNWGFSYWSRDPWLYNSWNWGSWYYSRWHWPWSYSYWDYWYHYRWHDPWFLHNWHSWCYDPWIYYPGYYGYSYYPGYYDYYVWDYGFIRGVPGERQSLGFGRSWGSRDAISRSSRGDLTGSYGSSIRRSSSGASRLSSVPNHRYGGQDGYRRVAGGNSSRTGSEGVLTHRRAGGSYEGYSRSSSGYGRASSSSRSAGGGEAIRRSGPGNYRRPAGSDYGETGGNSYQRSSGGSYRRSSSSSYGSGSTSNGSYSRSSGSYNRSGSSSYGSGSSSNGSYSRSGGSSSSYGGGSSSGGSYSRSSGSSSSYGSGSSSNGSYSRSGGSSGGGSYRR